MNIRRIYNSLTNPLRMLPSFIIIGVQKGGSSSLFHYLMQHPSILKNELGNTKNLPKEGYLSKKENKVKKEMHYFDRHFDKGIRGYRSKFPFPKYFSFGKKYITGEATPDYISHPRVPQRVYNLIPKVKLILLLRNPVDRAYSHYIHHVVGRTKETRPADKAIFGDDQMVREERKRIIKHFDYQSSFYERYSYLYRGIYIEHIQTWLNVFDREQLLILKSEDMYSNPNKIYQEVLNFLELPGYELREYEVFKPRNTERLEFKKKSNSQLENKMSMPLRKKLSDYYRPYNEKLYKYLDRDFGWD